MAFEVPVLSYSFSLNDSSTASQYYIVKMSTTASTVDLTTAAGEECLGVVQDASSSGGLAAVMLYGITKVAHDGTLNPGDLVMASSAGLATETTTTINVYRIGKCIESGSTVSGSYATIFLNHLGPLPSTTA